MLEKHIGQVLSAIFVAVVMTVGVSAKENGNLPKRAHRFETLLVTKAADHTGVCESGHGGKKVYEHRDAKNAIEWSLANARITVVTEGRYLLSDGIHIKTPGVSLTSSRSSTPAEMATGG